MNETEIRRLAAEVLARIAPEADTPKLQTLAGLVAYLQSQTVGARP